MSNKGYPQARMVLTRYIDNQYDNILLTLWSMSHSFLQNHLQGYSEEGYPYLARMPEVKNILDADLFDSIVLVREKIFPDFVLLDFEVSAPKLSPNPRASLVDSGVVDKHNILHTQSIPDGKRLTLGFFGASLQIALNIRDQVAGSTKDNN
jgi:hypothetical protein